MTRQDLLTNEEFIPLRINQKFATPENRIKYYNNKANELRHSISYVNKPLHNNLKILNEIMKGLKEKVFHKQFLYGKGFDFAVHTHVTDVADGTSGFALYDYSILNNGTHYVKILKK